jgi:hypothetical protein
MVCQLRTLVYSLGLNNLPSICLTPKKSRVKNFWRNKQGNCRCKMAGAGIWSFAKFRGQIPQIDRNNFLANRSQVDCGLPSSPLRLPRSSQACGNPLSNSYFFSVAILMTVNLFLAIHILNAADCHNPQHTFERWTWQETEFQLPPFTSRVPLFEASSSAWLLEYKIPTQRIV